MIRIAIIFLVATCTFFSCENHKTEKEVRLSYNERREVDTLYRARVMLIAPQLDSLCQLNKKELLQKTVDSIKNVRKAEEKKLLERTLDQQKRIKN